MGAFRHILLTCSVALAVFSGACDRKVAGGKVDGEAVYAEACARCHGPAGTPDEQLAASLGVKDLAAPEFRERATPASVRAQVLEGSDNKVMPSFAGALTDEQLDALVSYVLSLAPQPEAGPGESPR